MNKISKKYFSPEVWGLIVGVLIVSIGCVIASLRYQVLVQYQVRESQEVLELIEQNIERTIQESYSAALTLALTVSDDGEVENFEKVAEQIFKNSNVVDVLELVPDGVIEYVYPLEGNESVLGYDIRNHPEVGAEVLKAAELGTMYFAGPIELKQGGQAVIGRLPITIEGELWGFSAILLYMETLIEQSGIDRFSKDRYYFQLSKVNPNTGVEEFFLPINEDIELDSFSSVNFPEGNWRLYAKRVDTDFANVSFWLIFAFSILSGFLGGFMTTKFSRRPEELRELLQEKSEELLASREKFKLNSDLLSSILESPKDIIVFSLDREYNYLAFNNNHKAIVESFFNSDLQKGMNVFEFIPDPKKQNQLKKDFDKALSGEYFDSVTEFPMQDGSLEYWQNYFSPIKSMSGIITGLTIFSYNITKKVKAENQIATEKQLSDSIINSLPGVFYLFNKEGDILRWNDNLEEITNYLPEEIKEAHPLNFFHKDEKELITERIENVFVTGTDSIEADLLTKEGERIPYYFTGVSMNYRGQECLLGVGMDISEQKKIEKEINFEKQLSDSIINSLPGIFYLFNKEGKYLRWNDNLEEIANYTSEEIKEAHPLNFFHEDEKELLTEKIGNVFITGEDNVEADLLTKEGDRIPYYFTGVSMNYKGEDCLLGVGIDISEQKKAEQKHAEVLQQLQNHLYNSPLGVVEYDSDLNIISWSKRCEEIFGWSEQEMLGKNAFDIIYEQDKSKTEVIAHELTKGSVDSNISHNRNYTESGKIIDCVWYNTVVKNSSGKIVTVMSLVEDITEKKKTEKKIKENEKRYRALIENSPYCIHELDKNGVLLSINKAGLEMMGVENEEDFLGITYDKLVDPTQSKRILELFSKSLQGESIQFEFTKDEKHFLSSFIPITGGKDKVQKVMGITQDITERKKSEEIIENSLKEKTTLLSEIHHRVKNNLAIVSGLLQLQKNEVKDEKATAVFDQSINRIISIAMVHELMYKSPELSSINIQTYLDMLVPAISAAMNDQSRNIEFVIEIDEYKLNINQAIPIGLLLNELITNSFKYAFLDQEEGIIKINLNAEGEIVTVLYEDNGLGFGDDSNFDKPKNLGLNLIHTQLQQLEATYTVDTTDKFKLEFTFESEAIEPIIA
ncbi:MAG: PAS domain S-box protein [Balneola sp.]|nr:PAS domain S-box protein [Balneola sp.]MBO6652027.1 PAS domain S-box protein [Balneola sp.]MBO6711057.1 PAS domain S-box protein [Balneola sp.]MBO6800829.1 PAS domain S-box protein [Balneola sp.]MBO6868992.1 PAS domain S-box protein [Balneola sp.]